MLPQPVQVGRPGQGVPSPPSACSGEAVSLGAARTGDWALQAWLPLWSQPLCGGREPGLGQSSGPGHRCQQAALQPSNCPAASPAGAPGYPAPRRTVDGGDIPESCQRDSASGAEGGP